MHVPMVHHRGEAFKKELKKACEGMRWLLNWDSDPIFLASSGTGALEAALLNTCEPSDSIITVNGGAFGERWGKIARRLGVTPHEISVEWGSAVTAEQVRSALNSYPGARAFCIQHSETSTTVLHPVAEILALVKALSPSTLTIVDGISSCATTPMPGDPSILDIYIAGSQKALMLHPGLAIMALSAKAWERVEATPKRSLYFDLSLERRALAGGETSWTPATALILGLNAVVEIIRREGLAATYARHETLSRMARAALTELGCAIMAPQAPCPSVTGFFAPEGIDADALRNQVRANFGIRLAGGQGPFKGKAVRIGHMGYVDPFDLLAAISGIGLTLRRLGKDVDDKRAVTTALKELA